MQDTYHDAVSVSVMMEGDGLLGGVCPFVTVWAHVCVDCVLEAAIKEKISQGLSVSRVSAY